MNKELTMMFENIRHLCGELADVDTSTFSEPATEEALNAWEVKNGVKIPETYRKWLLISKCSNICGGLVQLFMPSADGYYGCLVPAEYVVVGNVIGDGERFCFRKTTGEFVRYDHGSVFEVGSFENILVWVTEYLEILLGITKNQYVTKIELLRRQAVQDFWNHERQLVSNGQCTRNWNFDEIEYLFNISQTTGNKRRYAGKPVVHGRDGKMIFDENGTPVCYECHCMINCVEYPEYMGDWRSLQALTPKEHILGAHGGGR